MASEDSAPPAMPPPPLPQVYVQETSAPSQVLANKVLAKCLTNLNQDLYFSMMRNGMMKIGTMMFLKQIKAVKWEGLLVVEVIVMQATLLK